MKKIYVLFAVATMYFQAGAQTLNQSADWPNPAWTITGSYSDNAGAFESDPTTTANFAFNDDVAGNGHEDNIAAESPVIDLTAAHTAGEVGVEVTVQYGYHYLANDVLLIEYWDADAEEWVAWGTTIPGNNTSILDDFCSIPKVMFDSGALSIVAFTPTQLSGFKYRISYDDQVDGIDWNYGFCFDSPTIKSISCITPSMLDYSNVTTTTADFSWQPNGTETAWEVLVLEDGSEAPTDDMAGTAVTTTPVYTGTLLSPATTYQFYVRANCGSSFSSWSGPISFITTCVPIGDFTEDFESTDTNVMPDCWSKKIVSTSEDSYMYVSGSGGATEAKSLVMGNSDGSTAQLFAISPVLDNLVSGDHRLKFSVKGSNTITFEVGTMTDPSDETTFTSMETYTLSNTHQLHTLNFDTSTTDTYIAFKATYSSTYYSLNIDDVVWEPIPSCVEPSDIVVSDVTNNSATIAWTVPDLAPAQGYEYVYSTSGDSPDSAEYTGTVDAGIVTADLASLDPATTYYVWVKAVCSGTDSSGWSVLASFKTACDPTGDFTENFDSFDYGTIPDCWSRIVNSSSDYAIVSIVDYGGTSDSNSVQIYNSGDNAADLFLITPYLADLGNDTHRIRFKASGGSGYSLIVGTMSNVSDPDTFTPVETINLTSNYTDYSVSFTSSTTDRYVAFKHGVEETYQTISIDDVNWEPIPTDAPECVSDAVATPDEECGNYATNFEWTAPQGAEGYTLTIGTTSGANDVIDNLDIGNVTTYSFTGDYNSTYFYSIIAYNDFAAATGCNIDTFTTAANLCYCASEPTSVDNNGVSNVQLGSTDFENGDVTYTDNTASPVDLAQGLNTNVQVSFETGYDYDTNIWIDFNDDFNFEEDELVYSGESEDEDSTVLNASFPMPSDAALGAHRMRLAAADSGQATPEPCYNDSYGVTIDFTVNIVAASCTPPAVASSTIVPDCDNNQYSIDIDITDLGSGTPSITDGITTWPVTATGVINIGPFENATTETLTVTHGTETICDLPLGNFNYSCPAPNDVCDTAIPLTLGNDFDSGAMNATTAEATTSDIVPDCQDFVASDVWFTVVVPDDGNLTIETGGVAGSDNDDTIMSVFSGTCDDLTPIDCSDDIDLDNGNLFSKLELTDLTPGETLYVGVWQFDVFGDSTQGAFQISAYNEFLSVGDFDVNKLTYYPNPVKDILNLSYDQEISDVSVFNMLGQKVYSKSVNATNTQLDLSALSQGTYTVRINADNASKVVKIIKQ
jgi:hypothetical protein